ncbi:hypothetical protein HNR12_003395 [Streptomonospora nanhaiensis]|uniref:Uncharacterized protein n=1 Tax=Streptomonospora nanhaiensis TaxID=1323731 RepID=A0A853BNT0_9ACTN|nr:hypothetical protein [Streptomonospora nanhaiensis]
MALLNDPASLPTPMWTVVRLLSTAKRPMRLERVRELLNPPALRDEGKMFTFAVNTLRDYGLVSDEGGQLALAGAARQCDGHDADHFHEVLRDAVLAPQWNTGIGENDSQKDARDLTRALCWFLSLEPHQTALNWEEAQARQKDALKPQVRPAIINDFRWTRFAYWSTALGLAAPSLWTDRLTPDCTLAVKQVLRRCWSPGDALGAVDMLHRLRRELPVLPGGEYSVAVGVPSPGEDAAGAALSFALLRGEHEGWITLERDADARHWLSIHDPESVHPLQCSSIRLMEEIRG